MKTLKTIGLRDLKILNEINLIPFYYLDLQAHIF